MNIPVLTYPTPQCISVEDIATEIREIGEKRIKLYILKDVFVAANNTIPITDAATWIYNEKGEVIRESLNFQKRLSEIKPTMPFNNVYEAEHIPDERVIWIDINGENVRYKCDCVYCLEPIRGFEAKTTRYLCKWAEEITKELSVDVNKSFPKKVFVKRIKTRQLENAEELLKKYGFSTMIPEELSVKEQIQTFYFADVIVCPHGANSSNVMFMRKGTHFIETFGKEYIYPCCLDIIKMKGISYQMLVERRLATDTSGSKGENYKIDEVLLEIALENVFENRC